jgi:hypothetical protein
MARTRLIVPARADDAPRGLPDALGAVYQRPMTTRYWRVWPSLSSRKMSSAGSRPDGVWSPTLARVRLSGRTQSAHAVSHEPQDQYRESFRLFAPAVRERAGRMVDSIARALYASRCAGDRRSAGRQRKGRKVVRHSKAERATPRCLRSPTSTTRQEFNCTERRIHDFMLCFSVSRHGPAARSSSRPSTCGASRSCPPEDAYRCFMRTEMDYLVLNYLLASASSPARRKMIHEAGVRSY